MSDRPPSHRVVVLLGATIGVVVVLGLAAIPFYVVDHPWGMVVSLAVAFVLTRGASLLCRRATTQAGRPWPPR